MPASRAEELLDDIERRLGKCHIYCGVTTRRRGDAGKKSDLLASRLVWADVDTDDTHRIREAMAKLYSVNLIPVCVVRSGSGSGFHVYIKTEDRLLTSQEACERQEEMNRRLCVFLGGDRACTDAARVMRLPGSLNIKHDPARACRAIYNENAYVYTSEEILARLPKIETPARPVRIYPTENSDWLNTVQRWAGGFDAPRGERHNRLLGWVVWFLDKGAPYSIVAPAAILAGMRVGLPQEEIEGILRWSQRSTGK